MGISKGAVAALLSIEVAIIALAVRPTGARADSADAGASAASAGGSAGAEGAEKPGGAGGGMQYSRIDRATVRVFALGGLEAVHVKGRRGKRYTLAIPLAGHGSGIKVSTDGLVLTAEHVVRGARRVVVKVPGSKRAFPARVIFQSKKHDIAFVSIPGRHKYYVPLPEKPPPLRVRQTVFAVGYPLWADRKRPQSTRGIISGTLPNGNLQLGLSVNPGNSGGPLVDEQENLLGIVVARFEKGAQGLSVAVGMKRIIEKYGQIHSAHERARRELASVSKEEWAIANLVSSLVQHEAVLDDAVRELYGYKKSPLERELKKALQLAKDFPDVNLVACAYYWNAAVVYREAGSKRWRVAARTAKHYCERIESLDPQLATMSGFLRNKRLVAAGTGYRLQNSRSASAVQLPIKKPPPDSITGFSLGASRVEVKQQCARHDLELSGKGDRYACSGNLIGLDAPSKSVLKFCGDKLCRVDIVLGGPSARALIDRYRGVGDHLEELFGNPTDTSKVIPAGCSKRFSSCLREGRAMYRKQWEWTRKRMLSLALGRYGEEPAVVVVYEVD